MVKMFRRSNGILYVEYMVNGRPCQKSTRLEDTPQNRSLVKKEVFPALKRKILLGEIGKNKPKKIEHYANIYLKDKQHLKSYRDILQQTNVLLEYFGNIKINDLNRGIIKEWVRKRLDINSSKTVREYLSRLRGICMIAIDEEAIKDNPVNNISLPRHASKDIEPFSQEEVATILDTADEWWKLFLAISFYCGLRTGETLALHRNDIDMDNRIIQIKRSINKGKLTTPKTQKSIRDVPIFDGLTPYLKLMPRSMYIFPMCNGKLYSSISGQKKQEWVKLLELCNIRYRKLYATRHTFIVSLLKNSDLSLLEIAQLAGHSSTEMIIKNYAKFIKGEHLKVDRSIKLYTDKSADSIA